MRLLAAVLLAQVVVMSPVTFAVYALDRRKARRRDWRISERTLHLLALAGGWPGAWLAQRWLRHKSAKRRFRAVFLLTVLGHVALVGLLLYLAQGDRI